MSDDKQKVEVSIMGKRYYVVCSPQQEEKLKEAVSFLNDRVAEIKHKMRSMEYSEAVCNRDNLLAIIAINLSYELIKMNTTISSKALDAEKLIEQIKDRFAQSDGDNAEQKISEMSL